jgi:DNA-binding transcriptional ArsR family regulator
MQDKQAIMALSALAQETRLKIFRVLVEQGPNGLAAGEIGAALEVPPATLSFHLKELERGGLVSASRKSRRIFYSANFAGIGGLIEFLTLDCCKNDPGLGGSGSAC